MISLFLLMVTFHGAQQPCSDEAIKRTGRSSDLVVHARVVEVGPSLGLWSGGYVVAQRVDYEVDGVLKGQLNEKKIRVAHHVIAGTSSVDKKVPRLSPSLFGKGNAVVLFLVPELSPGYISPPQPDANHAIRKFLVTDPNCGTLLATGKRFDHIKAVILKAQKRNIDGPTVDKPNPKSRKLK